MTDFSKVFDGQVADTALDFLEMFAGEEEAVLGFPSIQALTHVQKSPTKIKKENPWGFYISSDVAEMINFQPDAGMWKPITFYSSADTPFNNAALKMDDVEGEADIETHTGFISQAFSFHIVAASGTEIYEIISQPDGPNRYKFVDVKWRDRNQTAAAELLNERTKDNRPTHRWVKRYLLKLVDKGGEPLHEGFVQYRSHGGAGGSFGYEVNQYQGALTTAYSKARGKRIQPGPQFKALCRISMGFDITKIDNATIGYLDPSLVIRPVATVTKPEEVQKRDKKGDLRIVNRALSTLVVSPHSELGKELIAGTQDHADYAKPPSEQSAAAPAATTEKSFTGHLAAEMTQILEDGSAKSAIDTGEEFESFEIPAGDLMAVLDCTDAVQVTLKNGVLVSWGQPSGVQPAVAAANYQNEDF